MSTLDNRVTLLEMQIKLQNISKYINQVSPIPINSNILFKQSIDHLI